MQTFITSKGDRVVSDLTDQQAAQAILDAAAAGKRVSSFALDLTSKMRRYGLSAAQRPWLHKIALDLTAPAAPAPVATDPTFLPLVAMLQRAAKTLKNPRVKVVFPAINAVPELTLQLSVAGPRAAQPGSLNVTDGGPYGANQWFGRIRTDGTFEPSRRGCPSSVVPALTLWAAAPVEVARAHGRRTANCCFCRRHLETRESLAVGYGPVCADHFGLPWGSAVATQKEREEEEAALRSADAEQAA